MKRFVLFAAVIHCAYLSCNRETVFEKAHKEFEAGRYREAVFLIRHHMRRGGEPAPDLYFLEGQSWLKLGVAANAEAAFGRAFEVDSTWAPQIARTLRDEAVSSISSGAVQRGTRYLFEAIAYDSNQDFGEYNKTAGELLLEQKRFDGAIDFFRRYLEEYPDTAGAAEVMLNLGAAYEGNGESGEAIAVYRSFQERFPKSRLRTTAGWKLENLLIEKAEGLCAGGAAEESERILVDLAVAAANPLIRERANFLLAETYENRGDIERAIHYYTEVVNLNLGSSGRLAERAKERIERIGTSRFK